MTLHQEFDLRGAIEVALSRADTFLQRALSKLRSFPSSSFKQSLEAMPEYILCRNW